MAVLDINLIRIDGGTQPRAALNEATVAEYAEALRDGATLPPIAVFHDGSHYWLADGFHRYHAHLRNGAASIAADVRHGDRRAAVLFSVGANGAHGLRRTNEDKRRAVSTLLNDDEWSAWSDRKIAEQCAVSAPLVGDIRRSICKPFTDSEAVQQAQAVVRTVERSGKVYQQNTANIGNAARQPQEIPRPEPKHEAPANDDGDPDDAEIAFTMALEAADRALLDKLIESDDKLAAAVAECKRLNAVVVGLEARIRGLQNESNEAKRLAKFWQKKAKVAA